MGAKTGILNSWPNGGGECGTFKTNLLLLLRISIIGFM